MFSTNPLTGETRTETTEPKKEEVSVVEIIRAMKKAVSREAKVKRLKKKLSELRKQNALLKEEARLKKEIVIEQQKKEGEQCPNILTKD